LSQPPRAGRWKQRRPRRWKQSSPLLLMPAIAVAKASARAGRAELCPGRVVLLRPSARARGHRRIELQGRESSFPVVVAEWSFTGWDGRGDDPLLEGNGAPLEAEVRPASSCCGFASRDLEESGSGAGGRHT
jgi:hypothetical protein